MAWVIFLCWAITDNLNLHISKKYSTFAAQFQKCNALILENTYE